MVSEGAAAETEYLAIAVLLDNAGDPDDEVGWRNHGSLQQRCWLAGAKLEGATLEPRHPLGSPPLQHGLNLDLGDLARCFCDAGVRPIVDRHPTLLRTATLGRCDLKQVHQKALTNLIRTAVARERAQAVLGSATTAALSIRA
jgi:hypothetical protein